MLVGNNVSSGSLQEIYFKFSVKTVNVGLVWEIDLGLG